MTRFLLTPEVSPSVSHVPPSLKRLARGILNAEANCAKFDMSASFFADTAHAPSVDQEFGDKPIPQSPSSKYNSRRFTSGLVEREGAFTLARLFKLGSRRAGAIH